MKGPNSTQWVQGVGRYRVMCTLSIDITEMCGGTEAGSYLRLTDSCITQFKAQGPSRTCNESKEEEEEFRVWIPGLGRSAAE